MDLLVRCLSIPRGPIKQSAYALLGDLASGGSIAMQPHLPSLMREILVQLEPHPPGPENEMSVSSNATWSLGTIALRCGRGKAVIAMAPAEFSSFFIPRRFGIPTMG
jgi:transportin-1